MKSSLRFVFPTFHTEHFPSVFLRFSHFSLLKFFLSQNLLAIRHKCNTTFRVDAIDGWTINLIKSNTLVKMTWNECDA